MDKPQTNNDIWDIIDQTDAVARLDTAKSIFAELDKILPLTMCSCGHERVKHTYNSAMRCQECNCVRYELADFVIEYYEFKYDMIEG